jgi:predicted RecA/RadA family phage recombinase
MATNQIFDEGPLSVVCSNPASPASGDPVRYGSFTGVALADEDADGNTPVDFRENVWDLSVKAVNAGGNSAVAVGDAIYYVDADTPKLSKKNTGYLFGFALEAITSGSTATIRVKKVSPGFSTPADGTLDGGEAAVVADANVVGGLPVLHRIDIAAGALGDTDVVLTHKTRVIDAWLVLRGAGVATTTLTVKNGATAITDAMAASGSDKALVRCATLDDDQWEIAAAGTLRVTSATGATQPDATVFVLGIRVS